MAFGYLEMATNLLEEHIGKYVTIYHKWNHCQDTNSYDIDECVVKIVGVTPTSLLVPIPSVEVEFANGKKAKMEFASEYHGQLLLFWDYQRLGRLFNDFFVKNVGDQWQYTYPDAKCGEVLRDFYLKTGIHQIKFHDTLMSEKAAVVNYRSHLEEADANREQKRIEYENRGKNVSRLDRIANRNAVSDLDRIFHTA